MAKKKTISPEVEVLTTSCYTGIPQDTRRVIIREVTETGEVVFRESLLSDEAISVPVDCNDVNLNTLLKNGVNPRHLDITDPIKLGCSEGLTDLSNYLNENVESMFEKPNE